MVFLLGRRRDQETLAMEERTFSDPSWLQNEIRAYNYIGSIPGLPLFPA